MQAHSADIGPTNTLLGYLK